MEPAAEHRAFLAKAASFNDRFNAVLAGQEPVPLLHSFWSAERIAAAGNIQADWDLPGHLVPFYGDWHNVICLDSRTGGVLMMDDSRRVVRKWASTKAFEGSLRQVPEQAPRKDVGKVKLWLDDSLKD